jgi:hypothetical protein
VAWSRVCSFTDPLACQAAFPYSDIEILPTTKDFRVEMTQVAMSRLWLQRTHISSPTVSIATVKPGRRSIGFLTESSLSTYHHCGIEVMPGDIIDNTLEAEHRRCGPGFDYGVLLRMDPSNSTVTGIATDHGFWELGRLAVTYRALFGESPSETLRRPAEQTAIYLNRPSSFPATELLGSGELKMGGFS